MKAVAACTFKLLSTNASKEVLDQALQITKTARAQKSNSIDVAMFDAAAIFFSRLSKTSKEGGRRAANQSDKENDSRPHQAFEAFLALLLEDDDSSRDAGSQPELLRKSRVQLALAVSGSEVCSASSRARLASQLGTWILSERSRPLREDMQKAKSILERV
jgi:hypothetical protein